MIRNILFDMGQVLLTFDRKLFLDRLNVTEEEKQLLLREVFLSVEWVQMDRGTKTEETALTSMRARLPEHLHAAAEELVCRWDLPLLPVKGMYELVEELKAEGYGVYLLSNASIRQHEYWPRLPVSRLFDGKVISADHGFIKPQPEIYDICLKTFGLKAEECFFVDDVPGNIEGALCRGISGTVFHGDVKLLRKQLRAAGIAVIE